LLRVSKGTLESVLEGLVIGFDVRRCKRTQLFGTMEEVRIVAIRVNVFKEFENFKGGTIVW
jgi:hypothetical protein